MTELSVHWQHRWDFGQANWPTDLERSTIRFGLNWRRDLNRVLSTPERSSVDSPDSLYNCKVRVENSPRAVTHVPTTKKPFDVLAEGLVSKNSRGDWTPLELFLAGIQGLEAGKRQCLNDGTISAQ
jgi:hypothetical protein